MCRHRRFGGTCCLCLQYDGIISTWTLQMEGKKFLWNVGVHTILTWCEIAEVRYLILKTSIDFHKKKEPWVFDAAMCNIKFSSSGTVSVAPDSCSSGALFFNFCTGISYANRDFWEFISASLTKGGSVINARYTIYIWAQWRTEGGGFGCSNPPPPKFRRYRWSPRSREQGEPASRFPFAVHCVFIWL